MQKGKVPVFMSEEQDVSGVADPLVRRLGAEGLFFLTGSAEIPLREPDGIVTTLLSNGWPRPLRN